MATLSIFRPKIRKRVLAVIEGKIAKAQEKLNAGHDELEKQHETDVRLLEVKLEKDKSDLADALVTEILGKIL